MPLANGRRTTVEGKFDSSWCFSFSRPFYHAWVLPRAWSLRGNIYLRQFQIILFVHHSFQRPTIRKRRKGRILHPFTYCHADPIYKISGDRPPDPIGNLIPRSLELVCTHFQDSITRAVAMWYCKSEIGWKKAEVIDVSPRGKTNPSGVSVHRAGF